MHWRQGVVSRSLFAVRAKLKLSNLRSCLKVVNLLTLQAVSFSLKEDIPSELEKAADYLGTIRDNARPELRALLDLQIAAEYVEIARLEQEAGDANMADRYRQTTEGILRSLGWRDVSAEAMAKLTRGQLWQKAKK